MRFGNYLQCGSRTPQLLACEEQKALLDLPSNSSGFVMSKTKTHCSDYPGRNELMKKSNQ